MCAEGIAGLSHDACVRVGRAFKAAGGGVGTPAAKAKNDSVLTGRDSLFQTFRRAMANYNSGYNIPQPPLPPKTFNVTSAGDGVDLAWDVYGGDPLLKGFLLYRTRDRSDGTYSLVASLGASERSYKDTALSRGYDYYYYLVSLGSAVAADPPVRRRPAPC